MSAAVYEQVADPISERCSSDTGRKGPRAGGARLLSPLRTEYRSGRFVNCPDRAAGGLL